MALIQIEPRNVWLKKVLTQLGIIQVELEEDTNPIFSVEDERDNEEWLKGLDPRKWKEQDHYRVLGIGHRRHLASEDEIKQAYKKKVLTHHPDKRNSQQEKDEEIDYFSCITKGDPIKRRSYDSVDEYFDDNVPPVNAHSKANFYSVFRPVFARNARWSSITPVPKLGDNFSTKEEVERFYDFWYNFESWREYSYLDEEDKERGQDKTERKWIERQNKVERQRRKKEEMNRIRKLVDNAYACDLRIARFKEEAKMKKLMEKKAKEEARRQKQEDEERKRKELEKARLDKEREEEEINKAKREQERKEKEVIKKQRKKDKKLIETCFEKNQYFASDDKEKIVYLQELNKIFLTLDNQELTEFKDSIVSVNSYEEQKKLFLNKVRQMNNKINQERQNSTSGQSKIENRDENSSTKAWSPEDVQLLIKAVNLFPAGTQNRWDVIAAFVNQHTVSINKNRKAREVLSKAKDLSKIDVEIKQELNKASITKLLESNKSKAKIDEGPSQRYVEPKETKIETKNDSETESEPWTNEEQQLLEQALKSHSASTPDRWDRIAECIPRRSKKDCMKRYKELVELVKAKKAAKDAARIGVKK